MTKQYDIIWLETVDSTNKEAKRLISTLDNLSVLSAFEQTAGKGQRTNQWLSESGSNLTFSIVIKTSSFWKDVALSAHDQFTISKVTAESIVELLGRHGIESWIKLPNDVYVDKLKVCGILIENSILGNTLEYSIIGVGLNVNQIRFDPILPNPVSMRSLTGKSYDLHCLLNEFMDIFSENLKAILSSQQ